MITILVFAIALLLAVLISKLIDRSVLSTAVLFLLTGFIAGEGVLGIVRIQIESPVVSRLFELALFSILFTDGMHLSIGELASVWKLPGRALFLGLPLTLLGTAVAGHYVARLTWAESFLVGAILSPTDPVFAAAIIGREEIPERVRHLLSVESGLNDGLALPLVLIILAMIGAREVGPAVLMGQLALGVVLGIALPWAAGRLEKLRFFSISRTYEPLFAFAVGLLLYAVAGLTHANEYLCAYAAGITLVNTRPDLLQEFHPFGENLAELLKLAALLVFGALISPSFLAEIPWTGYLFALIALVAVRPIALWLALLGSGLSWREQLVAFWFGPKGFASVIYGILMLDAGVPRAWDLFHLVALVIAGSIIAHSSTDLLAARWFAKTAEART